VTGAGYDPASRHTRPACVILLISVAVAYAASWAAAILGRWDPASGSELQLGLERRTYLISTIVAYTFALQLCSLFLFIHVADQISHLIVGAMCAAGALSANAFGYPTLLLKVATFILGGLWLLLNHADNRGYDYPLIRRKYQLLLLIVPFVLTETVMQALFFLKLRPEIITSCCGALFSAGSPGIASEIAAMPPRPTMVAFYFCVMATITAAMLVARTGKGACLFALMSAVAGAISLVSLISFISLYYYESPSHHCPFCILQQEYGHVGYLLFPLIFGAMIAGLGTGLLQPFREQESLSRIVPQLQRTYAAAAALSLFIWLALVTFKIVTSNLVLFDQAQNLPETRRHVHQARRVGIEGIRQAVTGTHHRELGTGVEEQCSYCRVSASPAASPMARAFPCTIA